MSSSQVARTARQVMRSRSSVPRALAPRQPFVCSRCRSTASLSTSAPVLRSHAAQSKLSRDSRPFATSQTRRHERSQQDESPTAAQSDPEPAPDPFYALFPRTFPKGPPPASPFTPDLSALRREFLTLQSQAHPDLAAPGEAKRRAETLSAIINDAYRTLQDPLRRAVHLLRQRHGVDIDDESAKLGDDNMDAMLLMEVMEAREAVENARGEEELEPLREENDARIAASVAVLDEAFAAGNTERAAGEAVRLRYWRNVQESIKEWEEGKENGGVAAAMH